MNNEQKLPALLSLVMVVATATLGWMSFGEQGGRRVADTRALSQVPPAEQNVVARLWEDPLQAIQSEITKKPAEAADAVHSVAAMERYVGEKVANGKVLIMVVPVPDTPFPDDLEVRLRLRYATQMALAEENYAPDNRNYLGYFRLTSDDGANLSTVPGGAVHVPYEWFVPRANKGAPPVSTLVLWLPESVLSRDPIGILARLRSVLYPPSSAPDQLAGIFVIGPRSSDTLRKMISSANVNGPKPPTKSVRNEEAVRNAALSVLQNKLSIFSPQSTTPDPLLSLMPRTAWSDARADFGQRLQQTFGTLKTAGATTTTSWEYFHNFIAPDDQLTDLLVLELGMRGLDLIGESDKILVLAEADTAYGRSLPVALQASLRSYRIDGIGLLKNGTLTSTTPKIISRPELNSVADPRLIIYRYLRGLDQQKGQEGPEKAPIRSNAKSPEELLSQALSKDGPMALGESQLDYANRLADDIRSRSEASSVKAVGVLGGDIYDKLILLRSLRPKFPGAVFFTTDIDARFWHPDHLSFTRNMVVASAYGIYPDAGGNGVESLNTAATSSRIAPFRDGYQLAVFRAIRAAIEKARNPNARIATLPPPAVFEIGKSGPVMLTPLQARSDLPWLAEIKAHIRKLFPGLTPAAAKGLSYLAIALLIAVITWAIHDRIRRKRWIKWNEIRLLRTHDGKPAWMPFALLGCVVVGAFCIMASKFGDLPGAEPWAWQQGVSVWPTEIIRTAILFAVVTTFVWAWQHYSRSRDALLKRFFGDDVFKSQLRAANRWAGLHLPWPTKGVPASSSYIDANAVFDTYLSKAHLRCRFVRVFVGTLIYLVLASGLIYIIDGRIPETPHIRGSLARGIDKFLLIASVVSFISLVYYVLDAVCLSARLLRRISGPITRWPGSLVETHARRLHVRSADLSGYLDVQFAAQMSREVGKLVFFPFVIQFLFILSRASYFDNWTWPAGLISIFVCNIVLASIAWAVLRDAAQSIRSDAQRIIEVALDEANHDIDTAAAQRTNEAKHSEAPVLEGALRQSDFTKMPETGAVTLAVDIGADAETDPRSREAPMTVTLPAVSVRETPASLEEETDNLPAPSAKARHRGLLIIQREIERERQGAYAQFFQDPALIAMVLPTGVFGILLVLARSFFGRS